jgi:iron only hydrogenase large subunit-like protein
MKICPTEAIRIFGGKAEIQEHRCIDCGKCYEVCPSQAISIKDDDFEAIHRYSHSVALLPAVFMGQFPDDISVSRVYASLQELGFAHVMEVESAAMIYKDAKEKYAREHPDVRPFISSFCPAIVRLIQIKYPSLTENILPIKVPLDISAMYALEELQSRGIPREEIGLFYITPCAAKVSAVKAPVGEEKSLIDGVINMNLLYNRVYKHIKDMGKNHQYKPLTRQRLSADAVLSTLTNGERRICTAKRSYSIDGIENVMDFLDKLENDEVEGVEFLELRACDQSCAGALLSVDNRFLCGERMYARARKAAERERNGEMARDREMEKYRDYLIEHSLVDEVEPRSMMVLDENIAKALEKMEKIEKMKVHLPQIDCGVCGAPTCEAFATDVVCGRADLHRCVFYRLHLEQEGKMTLNEGRSNMYSVWGDDRISGEIEV